MKFVMAVQKHDKVSIGRAEGHNARLHQTASQLPSDAWFTSAGQHTIEPWHQDRIDAAKALAKRKDAVVAVEFIFQIGNQTDWREPPTDKHPEGKRRKPRPADLNALAKGVRDAVTAEFGAANLVSLEVHTDESTPHVHAVVVPVNGGKLQAKAWLDGPAAVAALRKRVHTIINRHVPCEYTPGASGGAPHDAGKAAGKPGGQQPPPGLLGRLGGALDIAGALANARKRIAELEAQVQSLFSRCKTAERVALDRFDAMQSARVSADALGAKLREAQAEIRAQKAEIERLSPPPPPPEPVVPGPRPGPRPASKPKL